MNVVNVRYELDKANEPIGVHVDSANDVVAGKFSFRANNTRRSHCLLLSSRFNQHSREENGPFPGWFVQIVGNNLSLAFGNGKTWTSVKSTKPVVNNTLHTVEFSLNNVEKRIDLYFDGELSSLQNVTFRQPCDYLNICALNNKREFPFDGEIHNLQLGDS